MCPLLKEIPTDTNRTMFEFGIVRTSEQQTDDVQIVENIKQFRIDAFLYIFSSPNSCLNKNWTDTYDIIQQRTEMDVGHPYKIYT